MSLPRLLIVDDDAEIAEFIADVAEELGFETTGLSDTKRFTTVYQELAPGGLILDLAMPEMDGVEVLRFLGEIKCSIPILLFSGFDPRVVDASARLGRAQGLNIVGILLKPATVQGLRTVLTKAFGSSTP